MDIRSGLKTPSNHFKTDPDQPSPCIQQVDGSDNILITHKKFHISFDFLFGKRFYHSFFVLELMQPEIESFLLHEIGMMTGFDDPAPV